MASPVALIALFTLALNKFNHVYGGDWFVNALQESQEIRHFAGMIEARKDPGEYWQGVVAERNEALVEAVEHLVHVDSSLSSKKKITSDCHTLKKDSVGATNKKSFVRDFEPRPNVSAYGDDAKLKENKSFIKDFEPRPNVSAYVDGTKQKQHKSFMKDFEPRPNVSVYDNGTGLKGEKNFDRFRTEA